jgi:transposase
VPARSRRFSPAEHARALSLILDGIKREQVAKTIGCTTESLHRWYAEGKKQGLVTKVSKRESQGDDTSAATKPAVAEPAVTSTPHDPGAGLGEHEVKAILDYKKKHPSMGPAQIRAQLKRFLGWRVSVKAIARVLRKAGYAPVHRKGRPVGDEHPRRFEAPHRNSIWQLDFTAEGSPDVLAWPRDSQMRVAARLRHSQPPGALAGGNRARGARPRRHLASRDSPGLSGCPECPLTGQHQPIGREPDAQTDPEGISPNSTFAEREAAATAIEVEVLAELARREQ